MKPNSSRNRAVLPDPLGSLILTLCEDAPSPRAQTVYSLVKAGEWDQLATLSVDPNHYPPTKAGALMLACDGLVSSLLRKCEDLPTSFDREAVAEENFTLSERQCYRANERLFPYLHGYGLTTPADEAILSFFREVRKEAGYLLGPCPDGPEYLDLIDFASDRRVEWTNSLDGRFGPGATYGDKGKLTTVPDKMSSRPTLTRDSLPFLFQWAGTAWATACADHDRAPTVVRGNRFTTVPKDCTKFRGIAVEPSVNVFYQLAYGSVMKRRLRSKGFDLLRAQDIHKQVAREASIRGHLATVDFRNASDTVSKVLVELCLPEDWFSTLDMLRSRITETRKGPVYLEKFSSMGNGFTFELETVIFLAVSRVVCRQFYPELVDSVLVFGDDLIVPTEVAQTVITTLRFCGLETNDKKSFVSGPFRESCGGDYFKGTDVRPFFLKEYPSEPQHLISLANGLRRFAYSDTDTQELRWQIIRRAWFRVLDAIPSHIRASRGPSSLGDIVIHDDEHLWQHRWRGGIRYLKCYRPVRFERVSWEHFKPSVVLASALYGVGDGSVGRYGSTKSYPGLVPRDAVSGHKVGWVPYS